MSGPVSRVRTQGLRIPFAYAHMLLLSFNDRMFVIEYLKDEEINFNSLLLRINIEYFYFIQSCRTGY
jgi:hypothetical protein